VEEQTELYKETKKHTVFSTFVFLMCLPATLQANGISILFKKETTQHSCFIGLNEWYLVLLGLLGIHLLISLARTIFVKYNKRDSPAMTVIGCCVVMPALFFWFFIYTHKMDKRLELASGVMANELITLPNFRGLKLSCPHFGSTPIDL